MPKASQRITDTVVKALPTPEAAPGKRTQVFWQCPKTPGFQVRVSSSGDKAFVLERELDGKTVKRTLGKATGRGAISAEAARKLLIKVSSDLQAGNDPLMVKRARQAEEKKDSTTLAAAVADYVDRKRRGKDGLPLTERTKADYLAMVAPGGKAKNGKPFADGALFPLASKPLHRITAVDIRSAYAKCKARSPRQADYAMQVLRAVLKWHGVKVDNSPLSPETAGKDRIILKPTKNPANAIPKELRGAWWRAATERAGHPGADALRFMLLTGCRPEEVFGAKYFTPLAAEDVDLVGGRALLRDTKNRTDFTILLSRQALEVITPHVKGRASGQAFQHKYPSKILDSINKAAGVESVTHITPHNLRDTFTSIAERRVSAWAVNAMTNHVQGDVTGGHYIDFDEDDLRAAWQTMADAITTAP